MSITATFYSFSKKKNSTKRPSGGTNKNILIKDPSSVLNPTIMLETSNPTAYNYCYISTFGRYYWIADWTSDHGFWIANCSVDVLATYSDDILSSYQYVLRSATTRNEFIQDNNYPMDAETDMSIERVSGTFPVFNSARYVLAVTNGDSYPKINGVQYLCCDQSQLNAICAGVLNGQSDYWDEDHSGQVSDGIMRSIVNPIQYFGEAYMIPYAPIANDLQNVYKAGGTLLNNVVKLGSWNVPYTGTQLSAFKNDAMWGDNAHFGYCWEKTVPITLTAHPQAAVRGSYLNAAPFSQFYLYAGPFGRVRLDTAILTKAAQLDTLSVDIVVRGDFKGKGSLTVTAHDTNPLIPDVILAKEYADLSVPITLTQTKNNILSWFGNAVGAAGSALSGNYTGAISGAANLVSSVDSIMPKPELKGVQGSAACIFEEWYLQSEYRKIVCNGEPPVNILGYPVCETLQLNTLTGFCQTSDPWLELACYDSEYDTIISYMTSGFFIEV